MPYAVVFALVVALVLLDACLLFHVAVAMVALLTVPSVVLFNSQISLVVQECLDATFVSTDVSTIKRSYPLMPVTVTSLLVSVAVVDEVLNDPSAVVFKSVPIPLPPLPVYVPVTLQILDCPLLMLMVVPLLMFPASRLVWETGAMVCVPVR